MNGKIVLVTGATSGIGKVTARELAKKGAHVVIVGRNPEKTKRVADELQRETGAKIAFLLADLSKLADVKKLAADFLAKYDHLDVLVNNAGAVNMKREVTVDGYELTFAANHLAYFVLANLLVPALAKSGKSGKSRIVNVASDAHRMTKLDFDDLMATKRYVSWIAYGRSKLANILFTRELARRVQSKGITVNAVHPGFVASNFLQKGGFWSLIRPLANMFASDEAGGARTSIYLASSPDVEGDTGKYFYKCKELTPSRAARNDDTARRLWEVSEKLTGLDSGASLRIPDRAASR